MAKLFTSPMRGSFGQKRYKDTIEENLDESQVELAQRMIDFLETHNEQRRQAEEDEVWAINNLEYDLRSSQYIKEKCTADYYAQNLYAALCNNDFIKNSVWPILKEEVWSCTWRYAGGIIADIQEQGDYIDWYCSGIRGSDLESEDDHTRYVSEGTVTDEIRNDLLYIGWIVKDNNNEE